MAVEYLIYLRKKAIKTFSPLAGIQYKRNNSVEKARNPTISEFTNLRFIFFVFLPLGQSIRTKPKSTLAVAVAVALRERVFSLSLSLSLSLSPRFIAGSELQLFYSI